MIHSEKKNKHMGLDERVEIQECLCKGMTFKAIAARIGKDPTTVSKEVKLHTLEYNSSYTKTDKTCPKLLKAPFVCNGCSKHNHCNCIYPRLKYCAKTAQKEYETILTESREGIPLSKEEFYENERIISEAVKNGQHIYHAITANELPVSKTTVYRHIQKGYYEISEIDLPRAVKFKHRKSKKEDYVPKGLKVGRSYEDFLHFIEENPNCCYTEMDTVIGRIGGKVIMTFQFVNVDFMFGILMDNKTAAEGGERIKQLKRKLDSAGYSNQISSLSCLRITAVNSVTYSLLKTICAEQKKRQYSFVIPTAHGKSLTLKITILYLEILFLKAIRLMISLRIPLI